MFEDLKEIICEYVDVAPETIKEDSRFIEDLGFNSYDFMSMVGEIEEKFDVEVEEREVQRKDREGCSGLYPVPAGRVGRKGRRQIWQQRH